MKKITIRILCALLCLTLLFSTLSTVCFATAPAENASELVPDGEKPLPTVEPLAITDTQKNYINQGIVMKIGSDNMLNRGTKQQIFTSDSGKAFGKPIKYDGEIYVPLAIPTAFAGGSLIPSEKSGTFTVSMIDKEYSLTVLNDRVATAGKVITLDFVPIYNTSDDCNDYYPLIALCDVNKLFPDIFVFSDITGLIIFTNNEISLDFKDSNDLKYMMDLMRSFVFNFLTAEEYYDAISKNTNDFTHPYIMADQEQFDFMNDVYEGRKNDAAYAKWLIDKIDYVDKRYFNVYTTLPDIPAITDNPDDFDFTKKPEYYELLAFEITNYLDCGIQNGKWIKNDTYDYGQYPVTMRGMKSQPDGYVGEHWNGGYEWISGRCNESKNYAEIIVELALSYQITREEKYAILAWEMTESLMKWDHWSQGHFLNCAGTALNIGITYDWLYNVWNGMGYDTNKVAQAIYEKCVFYGYIVSLNLATHKYSKYFDEDVVLENCYGTTEYNRIEINWNAVCTSGLAVGMLSILGAEDKNGNDKLNTGTEIDFTTTKGHGIIEGGKDPITRKAHTHTEGMNILYWLLESNLYSLAYYGLKQYAPDGSFVEGPGYWSYATNNLLDMLWAIDTATGDDQGWHEFWGIDATFYFAVYTEYPDLSSNYGYYYWAFHDCSYSYQTTTKFFFAAEMVDDDNLAAIRLNQIRGGKGISTYDILGYKERYLTLTDEDVLLEKDYLMRSINGVTSRSDWEKGCIFTGLIGNNNNDTAHGQTDSGAFTYASHNYTWFVDMGADDYDVAGYFTNNTTYRQTYYRNCAEGANTICMASHTSETDFRAGQYHRGGYYLMHDEFQSCENGSVTIQDGKTAFGNYSEYAYRGLLFTNDRSTVVIQDQIKFKQAESIYWIAHTKVEPENIVISTDGKMAFLKHRIGENLYYLRATIVSDDKALKFQLLDAGINDYLLSTTHRPDFSESNGGEKEYSRGGFRRLVIKAENTLSFNCAVVIEEVNSINYEEAVGYSWTDMFSWDAEKVYKEKPTVEDTPAITPQPEDAIKMSDITTASTQAQKLLSAGYAFSTRMPDFFRNLCIVYKTLEVYPPESFANRVVIKEAYSKYLQLKGVWDDYSEYVNKHSGVFNSLVRGTVGIAPKNSK